MKNVEFKILVLTLFTGVFVGITFGFCFGEYVVREHILMEAIQKGVGEYFINDN